MGERSPRYLDVAVSREDEINMPAPNSLLPTEHQLAERFGIAPRTLVLANTYCWSLTDGTPGEARRNGWSTTLAPYVEAGVNSFILAPIMPADSRRAHLDRLTGEVMPAREKLQPGRII